MLHDGVAFNGSSMLHSMCHMTVHGVGSTKRIPVPIAMQELVKKVIVDSVRSTDGESAMLVLICACVSASW